MSVGSDFCSLSLLSSETTYKNRIKVWFFETGFLSVLQACATIARPESNFTKNEPLKKFS